MTMNTNIASLYEFTLQQMAAESYFEGIGLTDTDKIRDALRLGTNRLGYPPGAGEHNTGLNEGYPGYTRMTTQQADEFLEKFKIVHQWSDNPTPDGRRPLPEGIDGKPKPRPNWPPSGATSPPAWPNSLQNTNAARQKWPPCAP